MILTPILYGVATAAALSACLLTIKRDDGPIASAAAGVVAVGWAACRAAEYAVGWDVSSDAYAFIDLLSCGFLAAIYERAHRVHRWLIAASVLFAIQSVLHLTYQTVWRPAGADMTYRWLLNIGYCAILACLFWGGRSASDVLHGLGADLLRWLRGGNYEGAVAMVLGEGEQSHADARPFQPFARSRDIGVDNPSRPCPRRGC